MKSFRQKVEETATYKQLNSVQKNFATSTSNLKHLQDGVTIASNIGYEKWKSQSGFSERNSNIVADIINNDTPVPEDVLVRKEQTFAHVQVEELARINSFDEWREFIAGRATESVYLALNHSGRHVKGLHLLNQENYPITVYETVLPTVASVPYHSLSHN
jgi:hypothetical protein